MPRLMDDRVGQALRARGWRLAEIRRRRGMTQAQTAAKMGVGSEEGT